MLRTNQNFLSYIETHYLNQPRKEDIVLKVYSKGEFLLTQGQKATKVMVLKEGITKCYFFEENDKQFIVEFLGKGEIVGEIEAISSNPCLCNIEAMNEVQAYHVSYSFFKSLLEKDLVFNNLLINVFTQRIIHTSSRASFQQLYTVEHSLLKLLSVAAKESLTITKEDMAAYLGITVRSLNRTMKIIKNNDEPKDTFQSVTG